MLKVALTGGIASGKTAVTDCFQSLNVPVVDADEAARAVVEQGRPALKKIEARFGSSIVDDSGDLNRRSLRSLVFSNQVHKKWLDELLHPLIRQHMRDTIESLERHPYCVVAIPLLVETGQASHYDRVLVVDVPASIQMQRLTARDGITRELASNMLNNQASRRERLAAATDLLVNTGKLSDLTAQVKQLHDRFQILAQTQGS